MRKISILAVTLLCVLSPSAFAQPLKVFILVGQSNMEGTANVNNFDYIGDDPATASLLDMMRGADGKLTVCDDVWISYLTGPHGENFEIHGKLTAGFGSMWDQEPTKHFTTAMESVGTR